MMKKDENRSLDIVAGELGYQNAKELCEALWQLKAAREKDLKVEELAELCDIEIEASLPAMDQMTILLKQTSNPFYYRCGETIIRISEAGEKYLTNILKEILFTEG